MPYAVLSAVAHAELVGLARNLPAPGTTGSSAARPPARPAADWARFRLWQDTYT